jgi:hypothetical protein
MGELIQGPWAPMTGRNLYLLPLSRELGRSADEIELWIEQGLPHGRDPKGNAIFSLVEVLDWLAEEEEVVDSD